MHFISGLYIACQSRTRNPEEFSKYENHLWPPFLFSNGNIRGGQKADLVKCLLDPLTQITKSPIVYAVILNGTVIVQMLPRKQRVPSTSISMLYLYLM